MYSELLTILSGRLKEIFKINLNDTKRLDQRHQELSKECMRTGGWNCKDGR